MKGNIEIVRMQREHLDAVLEIAEKNNLSYWSREAYESEITSGHSRCLVARLEEKIIGFIVARLIMTENYAEIYNIAVEEKFKNNGVGKILLSDVIKHCVINNLERINLEVRESNHTAVRFYLKNDFEIIGLRKNFYTRPSENAITMIKFLNK